MLRLFKGRQEAPVPRVRTDREKRMSAASDMMLASRGIPAGDLMFVIYSIIADKQPPKDAVILLIMRLQSMIADK